MNPELQEQLTGILSYLEQAVKATGEFAAEQAPDVIQQLLLWKFVQSFSMYVLALITIVITTIAWLKVFKFQKEDIDYWDTPKVSSILVMSLSVLSMFAIISLFANLVWLQIWIAPKVYLLEYASSLL